MTSRRHGSGYVLLLLLLLLCAAGCAPPPRVMGISRSPIINGTVDTGDPAVMLLLAQPEGGDELALCTATLIAPQLLLTAAHCVDPLIFQGDMGAPPTLSFSVYPGDVLDLSQPVAPTQLLSVEASMFDPDFNPDPAVFSVMGHDLGAVVLTTPLTITPIPFNTTASELTGQSVRVIGYGITDGTDSTGATAGTKRQTGITVQSQSDLLLDFEDGKHATCEGDSGGPALYGINGVETIVGITAFGESGCPVTQPSVDTRIDVYADEIDGWIGVATGGGSVDGGTSMGSSGPPATSGAPRPAAQASCSAASGSLSTGSLLLVAIGLLRRRCIGRARAESGC